jgi:hypothetical protein
LAPSPTPGMRSAEHSRLLQTVRNLRTARLSVEQPGVAVMADAWPVRSCCGAGTIGIRSVGTCRDPCSAHESDRNRRTSGTRRSCRPFCLRDAGSVSQSKSPAHQCRSEQPKPPRQEPPAAPEKGLTQLPFG